MKKIITGLILLYIVSFGLTYSQNTMRIDTLSGHPADTLTFSVKVNNVKAFVGFQTDIQLPNQLAYVNNSAALTGRANNHMFAASLVNSTLLRVIAYSFTMSPFLGNSGAVMTFKCIAGSIPGNNPGNYNLNLAAPILADSSNLNILTGSSNGLFTLLAPKISFNTGSINFGRTLLNQNLNYNFYIYNNGTSSLTVSKLSSNSPYIKFLDSSGFVLTAGNNMMRTVRFYADSKGIKYAALLIYSNDAADTLHSIPAQGEVYTTNEMYLNSVTVNFGAPGILKLRMKNTEPVNAFQISVTLPANISYVAGSVALDTSRKKDHIITASVLTGNVLKILSYSPTNQTFNLNDSTIAQFGFVARTNPGTYAASVSEGVISDTSGTNIMSNIYSGSFVVKSPVISLPASIVFDTISYTDTTRKQLTIQNTGTDTLRITGISANEPSFANETVLPVRISPGSSGLFTIRFANSNKGLHTGILQISHNDSLRNPGSVAVRGYIYKPTRLYVTSTDFNSRDTSFIPFGISNTLPFVAFQFDVTLPPQSAFIPNSAILTSRANGHQVYTNLLPNGDIRVIAFSMNQGKFTGDSGDVVKFKIAMNADTGIYPVSVKNIIISDSNNTNIATAFNNGFIRVNPYPPSLISPVNGSVGNPVNLNLYWHKSPFASLYHLQFATDSLFANKLINDSTYTDTTKSLSNLTPLTNYYWRVRIKYFSGASKFTNYWVFRTIGQPMQPQCIYPPQDTVNMPLSVTFTWKKTADQLLNITTVNKYWYELSEDSLFTAPLKDTTLADTLKTVSGLQNNKKYYWRIRAKNEIGWGPFCSIWRFSTLPPIPAAPVLVSPANNSIDIPISLSLVWNKSQFTSSYRVMLSTDSLFNSLVVNDSTLTDTTKLVSGLSNLTNYWWKVSAKNIGGVSSFSTTFKFATIIAAPLAPVLVSPPDNSTGNPTSLTLGWNRCLNAVTYRFLLSTDSLFNSLVVNDSTLTDSTKFVSGLLNLTNYWWKVSAKNIGGVSSFSATFKFTTIIAAPLAPLLVSPPDNSTGNPTSLPLVWNKSLNAATYRVQLSADSLFNSLVVNDSTLADSTRVVSGLNPLTNYWWKVNAKNAGGTSGYSLIYKFKTLGVPAQITGIFVPANGAVNQPATINFKWSKAFDQTLRKNINLPTKFNSQSILNYWFELTTDSVSLTGIIRDSTLADTNKTQGGFNYSTSYFWRVKAANQIGWGSFSYWQKFTTAPPPPATVTLKVIPAGFYDFSCGALRMRDTVRVYLVDSATCLRVDSNKVVLDSLTFTTSLSFSNAPTGNYYLFIYHRNHLPVASMYRQSIIRGSNVSYDLTTDSSKAFGFNMIKVSNSPVRWGMIPGDANRDEFIDGLDQTIWINQNGFDGYLTADFNGDMFVDGLDQTIWILYNGASSYLPCMTPFLDISIEKIKTMFKQENQFRKKENQIKK